ncbi:MAG: diphosphomevalonate decarboxylase [Flavobacteriaceae bacterium]|nr:diphosphomevalonate decarboxylase [Flavobacteriaceae bacterium]
MTKQDFIPKTYKESPKNGVVSYQSPSNIALVKYWGKHGEQLPENASISFTLSNCHTQTELHFEEKTGTDFDFDVYLNENREVDFEPKIRKFFERVEVYLPFLRKYRFTIKTSNSFPHSSGIASSASGMSALALCLLELERLMTVTKMTDDFFNKKASFLARLGSGSAARSIEGPLVVWGSHPKIDGSTNLYGIKFEGKIHENFSDYQDTILLVDKGEKQVSSTMGHNLMHNHPYAQQRFTAANDNLSKLTDVLESGNLSAFIEIVESEALQLHSMMMSSQPYFILMKPNTLEIINKVWAYRKATNSNICFTLDAGANVHVLYPQNEKEEVLDFIKNELTLFCKNGEFIQDYTGLGAEKL